MCRYRECECRECEDAANKEYYSKQFLQSIVGMLYCKEAFDEDQFITDLDELCGYLDVSMPLTDLQIQKKQKPAIAETTYVVKEWQKFNNQFLTQLTTTI